MSPKDCTIDNMNGSRYRSRWELYATVNSMIASHPSSAIFIFSCLMLVRFIGFTDLSSEQSLDDAVKTILVMSRQLSS